MQIKKIKNHNNVILLFATAMLFTQISLTQGLGGENPEKKIVASGIDFLLTQKVVDTYSTFFASQKIQMSQNEIIETALKYELLYRECRKRQGCRSSDEVAIENAEKVEDKIRDAKKYIPVILDNWTVSNAVIESYYRSNPEIYSMGTAKDGMIILRPLDDRLRSEIKFKVIEGNKEAIVKEYIDTLISKYHIVLNE
jgi:hypothetical protein